MRNVLTFLSSQTFSSVLLDMLMSTTVLLILKFKKNQKTKPNNKFITRFTN